MLLLMLADRSGAARTARPRAAKQHLRRLQGVWEGPAGYAWLVNGARVTLFEKGRPAGKWKLTLAGGQEFTLDWVAGEGEGDRHQGRYEFLEDELLLCSYCMRAVPDGQPPL